ncbi:MAG: type II toxin-antitoxin system RelE/ParE family toxin [Candidatus Wallbacteria bacterium]|nr:type II toxin-antitoxin system RelE/ParE family toxin [Candidatus Wallbacteria bacterium]
MGEYKVILHRDAARFYQKANQKLQSRIAGAIDCISDYPQTDSNFRKLHGKLAHLFRYRTGNIRLLFEIHEDIKTIRIVTIDYRGSVYKD